MTENGLNEGQNQKFFDMSIPFKCLLESEKTYNRLVGLSYFTVEHKFGRLEDPARPSNETRIVDGCTHHDITKTDRKDSVLYETLLDLIKENVPEAIRKTSNK